MQARLKPGDIVAGTHGKMKLVADFLPRPEELVLKEPKPEAKKVTIVLDDFTINTFKQKAQELGGSYQGMIRKLLLEYARTIKSDDKNVNGSWPIK